MADMKSETERLNIKRFMVDLREKGEMIRTKLIFYLSLATWPKLNAAANFVLYTNRNKACVQFFYATNRNYLRNVSSCGVRTLFIHSN